MQSDEFFPKVQTKSANYVTQALNGKEKSIDGKKRNISNNSLIQLNLLNIYSNSYHTMRTVLYIWYYNKNTLIKFILRMSS